MLQAATNNTRRRAGGSAGSRAQETVEKVKTNIDAVVAANRKTAEEGVTTLQRELARERQARQEADAVLEQTTLVRRRPPAAARPASARVVARAGPAWLGGGG